MTTRCAFCGNEVMNGVAVGNLKVHELCEPLLQNWLVEFRRRNAEGLPVTKRTTNGGVRAIMPQLNYEMQDWPDTIE